MLVDRLRQDSRFALVPLFLLKDHSPQIALRTDGKAKSFSQILTRADAINELLDDIGPQLAEYCANLRYRVLAFGYSRSLEGFQPTRDWSHPRLYSYPILESLTGLDRELDSWLDTLQQQGFLRTGPLIDRIRSCPRCGFAHLNFIDLCPHCESKNIVNLPFLHCFTCGTVAPEEEFRADLVLLCPQCRTRLRHIGTDYDRALEEYLCHDCGASFIEPKILANCTHCDSRTDPASLPSRQIHELQLTDKALIAARTGILEEVGSVLDHLQNLHFDHFLFQLNWFLLYCRRYQEETFSLVGLTLANMDMLIEQLGRALAMEMVEEYAGRLKQMIRDTDLTTRNGLYELWLLLPRTDAKGSQVLGERIQTMTKEIQPRDEWQLELAMIRYTFDPSTDSAPDNGRNLFWRLQAQLAEQTSQADNVS